MRDAAMRIGLRVHVDSAGTSGWHVGEKPDKRSIAEARRHGMDISKQRGRKFERRDFGKFDLILAMDEQNKRDLLDLALDEGSRTKVQLFMPDGSNVPDPYLGTEQDFARVYEMVRAASETWMERIKAGKA